MKKLEAAAPLTVLILSATVSIIAGCTAARLHGKGLAAIDRGDYETGVYDLSHAVLHDPRNVTYRIDFQTGREVAVQSLIAAAEAARASAQPEKAADLYRRVLAVDPLNDRAPQGLESLDGDRRHAAVVADARKDFERKDYDGADAKLRSVLNEDPGYTAAEQLASAINFARGPTTVAPHLQTRENRKVTLQLRDAPTKMVFEVLQRETGINFILDKDLKSDSKTSIFVQDVPVEQAIDLVLDQNQLARQILADNMVLIYPNVATKQKDYEQQIVRTFYLTNAAPKDVESMLKTVLGAKTIFVDERSNVVVIRDTPDAVRMAENLVASLDVAEPEVMLEVEVLEVSRSRLQDLGIQYPTSATLTPSPLGTAAAGVSAGGLVLSDLAHQNTHTIGVSSLSATVNAMKQAGVVDTLASPRIRARNKEKAKVLIGSREPVITNSVTPTAGGTPVVTGSVQYLDVGLTLEVQPTVYLDSDVAIKISLEVSSILKQVQTASGTIAYEIGTRNANTLLRLKDGETQILAGLIQDTDTRTANSIPVLGDIPLLGRLFGTHHSDREKDEIVLSITPHVIRMQPRGAREVTEFYYGTENRTRMTPYSAAASSGGEGGETARRTQQPGQQSGPAQTPLHIQQASPAPGVNPALPGASGAVTPGTADAVPPITAPPAPVVSNVIVAATPDTPGSKPPATPSALIVEGPTEAKVGQDFQVTVRLATDQPITRLRSQLRFDSTALQLLNSTTGDLVPAAAGNPSIDAKAGGAQLQVNTTEDEPVQGEGSLMVLTFRALAARPATSISAMLNVLGGAGAAVGNSQAPLLKIAIQP